MTEHQIAARLERWRLERDPAALGELLKAHRDRAYSVAARLLGPGEDAEDAVQEACLKLLSRTHGFEGPESFRAAVYRAVVQCGLNALRGRRRGRNLLEAARRDARTGEPSMPTPETASGEAELREIVRLAIEELPEDLRVAVMLCYLEGLRLNEAAEALEIPRQTLRDRLERAVGLLRADLARSGATFAPALLAGASMAAPAALLAKLDAALPGAPCAELAPVGPAPRAGDPFAAARAGRRGLAAAVAAALLLAMLAVGALLESRPRQQDAAAPAPPAAPVPAEIAAVVPLPEPAQPSDERNPEMNAQQLALTLAAAMALPAARAEEPAQPPPRPRRPTTSPASWRASAPTARPNGRGRPTWPSSRPRTTSSSSRAT
ncbi:MAG: sigma-70 family RNA polymerase sigma factor [Planctomycetota bacterium]|nr:sigma-70 family RNA polymerase sigma factor [Planctomycetota bacterium]